jgi:hypothetical protein
MYSTTNQNTFVMSSTTSATTSVNDSNNTAN